jgi:hypothetical protein
MHCRNCGKEIADEAAICITCGVPTNKGSKFCWNCGDQTDEIAEICVKCGVNLKKKKSGGSERDWGTTLGLSILILIGLGGIHRLYTGHIAIGIIQLLTWGGCGIWQLIDFIQILQEKYTDSEGNVISKQ